MKEKESFSYDDAMKQVEEIIAKLQNSDASAIDDEMSDVEKALEILSQCRKHLTKTNEKLDKLFEEKGQ